MIEIDGAMGEGGGQIVRSAIALAAIVQEDIRLYNIRRGRSNPGLKPQHLNAVKHAAEMCSARVEGLRIGSTEIIFRPGDIRPGKYKIDIGTAGSITLLCQCLIPIATSTPGEYVFEIRGGSDVPYSPPMDYFRYVFLENLRQMGIDITSDLLRRGYYPRGGGHVIIRINSNGKFGQWPFPAHWEFNPLSFTEVEGHIFISKLPKHISDRIKSAIMTEIAIPLQTKGIKYRIKIDRFDDTLDPGVGVTLILKSKIGVNIGYSILGRRGIRSETIGKTVASEILDYVNNGPNVDVHGCDQYLLYLAVGSGGVIYTRDITSHARTQIELLKIFKDTKFEIKDISERIKGIIIYPEK